MPKIKTNVTKWLPAKGQWFNVHLKRNNHLHSAGPFKCVDVVVYGDYVQQIEAVDSEGDRWHFPLSEFRFEPAATQKKT
jgi:hypothetical protein